MSDNDDDLGLELDELAPPSAPDFDEVIEEKQAVDLQSVFDVPMRLSAVLGHAKMPVSDLLNMKDGTVLKLDRKVGENIDIFVNDQLVARGEVVMVENQLGVTMTEIVKQI